MPVRLAEREWPLSHGDQRAVVAARGGALRSYRVAGRPVVDGWADGELPPAFNGAVLGPWPNRISDGRWRFAGVEHQLPVNEPDRQTALHGLVIWADWQLVSHRADAIVLSCRVPAQPGYPFDLRLQVRWSLTGDGLRCEYEAENVGGRTAAENIGARPAPFGIGCHPFFGFEEHPVDQLTLTVPARRQQATDDRLLPTELVAADPRLPDGLPLAGQSLDAAFTELDRAPDGSTEVVLSSPAGAVRIWADPAFGWWQVYTSDMYPAGSDRHRRSVAIEPMTCGPDAFNTGVDVLMLEPGQPWRASWGVRVDQAAEDTRNTG